MIHKIKYLFILLIFSYGFLIPVKPVLAMDVDDFLYSSVSFPNINTIGFSDLEDVRARFSINYDDKILYRKYIKENRAIDATESAYCLNSAIPFRLFESNNLLQIEMNFFGSNFSSNLDNTSTIGAAALKGTEVKLKWAASKTRKLFGLAFDLANSSGDWDCNIKEYPSSDDKRMNKYFLNWLEPTFGDTINGNLSYNKIKGAAWFSKYLDETHHLLIYISKYFGKYNAIGNYINSSNINELKGKRCIEVPVQADGMILNASLSKPDEYTLDIGILSDKMKCFLDNHYNGMIDYDSLGFCRFSRRGIFTNYLYSKKWYRFSAGLSGAFYSAEMDINTPVLGRTLLIFPISHAAEGKISGGSSFSQRIGVRVSKKIWKTNNKFSTTYTHSRYWLSIKGNAQLEFGLIAMPLNEPIVLDATLWDLCYQIEIPVKKIKFSYEINQFIPLTRRLDSSRFTIIKKRPGIKSRDDGARIHRLKISLSF